MSAIVVRPLQAYDCLQQLTELIHAAYVRCGKWDWRPHTNYLSVLMILAL
ncbi:hypothetical protein HBO40_18560 [Pseudomonas protegens]|nr:hypothetical protein [Pseudomonas protegens]NMZ29645.1 hypothetical protein [Pseudomonas protegens]NMZ86615.1 hypothetical protein [Pseudomonas protegens]WRV91990.1 hypothetical protein VP719_02875 [Pseudomonas protegens]BAO59715.1 hypothetical protein PPC_0368 [Pseudomonas protegens Cab57]